MGYELHIIRKSDYGNEEEDSAITLSEWLEYVSSDKELQLTGGYQMNIPNVDMSWKESPGYCIWIAHPGEATDTIWFDYFNGVISTKYPDDYTLKKMIAIAKVLKGRVYGDDNEMYDDKYFEEQEKEKLQVGEGKNELSRNKPWWKFW
jgi:hypothetical protein